MTKGILRNRTEASADHTADEIDRQEVIRNTQLNAQLARGEAEAKSNGDKIRELLEKVEQAKTEHKGAENSDHLKWDEINLYKTEQEKCATMKIDEPKTPYEGGFNPNGEYYQDDKDIDGDIPGFELGEGEFSEVSDNAVKSGSLNGGEIIRSPDVEQEEDDEEEEEEQLTAEERHKKFEEMRKNHYHMKGSVLRQGVQLDDDDDDE